MQKDVRGAVMKKAAARPARFAAGRFGVAEAAQKRREFVPSKIFGFSLESSEQLFMLTYTPTVTKNGYNVKCRWVLASCLAKLT